MKRDPNNKKPTKLLTAVTALLLAVGIVADVAMFGVFPSSLDKAFPGQKWRPGIAKNILCKWFVSGSENRGGRRGPSEK